ncbi:stage III sporulation protein AC [Vallitalea longa]|uniref:Stage III sporulation protein AC n=1 Tax=Vallitalea longa TaxID=2936439 RepID=A0A9W6DGR7_9FIRM|nr:stage III sporulation protein AC [Vallitalea longa]GKX31920.1 stage III sporulation protein AC [Vallitalea longa]
MDISIVFKIAAVGIVVAVLNQLLKKAGKDEQAMLTTLAGLVVVLYWIVEYISELFDKIQTTFQL